MGNAYYETNSQGAGGTAGFAPVLGSDSSGGEQVIFTSPDPNTSVLSACPPAKSTCVTAVRAKRSMCPRRKRRTAAGPVGGMLMVLSQIYAGSVQEGGRVTAVFFTSHEELTNDANTGGEDGGNDLYLYSLKTGRLTDITPDTNAVDANGAEVIEFIGASSDGSLDISRRPVRWPRGRRPARAIYMYTISRPARDFHRSGYGVRGTQVQELTYSPEISSGISRRLSRLLLSQNRPHMNRKVGLRCICRCFLEPSGLVSCNPSGTPPVESATLPRRPKGGFYNLPSGTLPSP